MVQSLIMILILELTIMINKILFQNQTDKAGHHQAQIKKITSKIMRVILLIIIITLSATQLATMKIIKVIYNHQPTHLIIMRLNI